MNLIRLSKIPLPSSEFYLKPDFSKLADPSIWSVAFGQAFFSLSIGMGVLVTYGSYIQKQQEEEEEDRTKRVKKRHISLVTSSSIVIISDISIAFLAGLMVFSFVFAENMDPTYGTSLVFRVMPAVFSNIGEDHHGSIIIAPLFFFLLLLAGITSSISMLQVPVSSLQDSLNMTKNRAALFISLLVFAFGIPSALSYSSVKLAIEGLPFLDAIDSLFGTYGLAIAAALFAIAVTWFMDKKIIMYQANSNSRIKFPCWIFTLVKFALPSLIISTVISQIILKS